MAHDELIRQVFYLLTAKLEDGAATAAEGQRIGLARDMRIELADRLHSLGQETMILADTIAALSRLEAAQAGAADGSV